MLFREWTDFVTHPPNPDRVRTREQRLDTSKAYRRNADGKYPTGYAPSSDVGMVIFDDDVFECMEVTDYGDVMIWTRDKVWILLRKNTNEIEKLMYLQRHPPK